MTATLSRPRKARKPHRCWLCDGTIHTGTVYAESVTFDSGDVCRSRDHVWCLDAARGPLDWWRYDEPVSEDPGEFRDALVEEGVTTPEDLERWCEHGPEAKS